MPRCHPALILATFDLCGLASLQLWGSLSQCGQWGCEWEAAWSYFNQTLPATCSSVLPVSLALPLPAATI